MTWDGFLSSYKGWFCVVLGGVGCFFTHQLELVARQSKFCLLDDLCFGLNLLQTSVFLVLIKLDDSLKGGMF